MVATFFLMLTQERYTRIVFSRTLRLYSNEQA